MADLYQRRRSEITDRLVRTFDAARTLGEHALEGVSRSNFFVSWSMLEDLRGEVSPGFLLDSLYQRMRAFGLVPTPARSLCQDCFDVSRRNVVCDDAAPCSGAGCSRNPATARRPVTSKTVLLANDGGGAP